MKVKERRINNPHHVRQLLQEQINILRQDEELNPIERARAITYASNVLLSAYRDGELLEKVKGIEKLLENEK